jgi:hypothetical protein
MSGTPLRVSRGGGAAGALLHHPPSVVKGRWGWSGQGADELPAAGPRPAVAGVERDVDQRHALQVTGERQRSDVDRAVADLLQEGDDDLLRLGVVAGDETVELRCRRCRRR